MSFSCFRKLIFPSFFVFAAGAIRGADAQTPEHDTAHSVETTQKHLKIGAYVDIYAGYLFSKPADKQIPYFVSSARQAEVNINLAFIECTFQTERLRARVVPGFGTYMTANYAAEPAGMRNLLEASAGYKLFKNKNIWLDAGILGSPYTNENAISAQHLMYTRSMSAENSPYYLSGVKLSTPLSPKTNLSIYLVNGWQQIYDQNDRKSVGTQLEFRPKPGHTFTWNTYVGDERSALQPERRLRLFTDVYWVWNSSGPWKATACAYAGMQAATWDPNEWSEETWWQANFILSRELTRKLSLAGRVEYFWDAQSVLVTPVLGREGFTAGSSGLCLNLKADEHIMFRLEGRRFFGVTGRYKDPLPYADTWICGNMSVQF
jgi:hypothetical protein